MKTIPFLIFLFLTLPFLLSGKNLEFSLTVPINGGTTFTLGDGCNVLRSILELRADLNGQGPAPLSLHSGGGATSIPNPDFQNIEEFSTTLQIGGGDLILKKLDFFGNPISNGKVFFAFRPKPGVGDTRIYLGNFPPNHPLSGIQNQLLASESFNLGFDNALNPVKMVEEPTGNLLIGTVVSAGPTAKLLRYNGSTFTDLGIANPAGGSVQGVTPFFTKSGQLFIGIVVAVLIPPKKKIFIATSVSNAIAGIYQDFTSVTYDWNQIGNYSINFAEDPSGNLFLTFPNNFGGNSIGHLIPIKLEGGVVSETALSNLNFPGLNTWFLFPTSLDFDFLQNGQALAIFQKPTGKIDFGFLKQGESSITQQNLNLGNINFIYYPSGIEVPSSIGPHYLFQYSDNTIASSVLRLGRLPISYGSSARISGFEPTLTLNFDSPPIAGSLITVKGILPEILSVSPENSNPIPRNSKFSIKFDTEVLPGSVHENSLFLSHRNGDIIPSRITPSHSNDSYLITPLSPLKEGEEISLNATKGLVHPNGNPLYTQCPEKSFVKIYKIGGEFLPSDYQLTIASDPDYENLIPPGGEFGGEKIYFRLQGPEPHPSNLALKSSKGTSRVIPLIKQGTQPISTGFLILQKSGNP